ncbi:MAG: hypothetical protein HY909_27135 [Deltaproteobacteria bacterium]|nr:hypothetical protein [Deltaproteobacteria bacterium]
MKKLSWLVPLVGLLVGGCGGGDGLRATGSVRLTVHQAGQPDGRTDFTLPADTFVDPPPGVGVGFYGTCRRVGGTWSVELTRAGGGEGLRSVTLSASSAGPSGVLTTTFLVGASTFSGSATCTGGATSVGDRGVRINGGCTALSASGDPRTVDASIDLTLDDCK